MRRVAGTNARALVPVFFAMRLTHGPPGCHDRSKLLAFPSLANQSEGITDMAERPDEKEMQMAVDDLYREEVFTDQQIGTIRRMTPVTPEGAEDSTRPVHYIGQTQLLTPAGALPISFEIEAGSIGEAARKFGEGAAAAADDTIRRLEEMRRDAASSIVLPGQEGPGGGGGMPDPRLQGGGKFKL